MTIPYHRDKTNADFLRHLEASGMLSKDSLERATHACVKAGHPVDVVLAEFGLMREGDIAGHLSDYLQIPRLGNLSDHVDEDLTKSISPPFLVDQCIVPLSLDHDTVLLAVSDPFAREAIDALAFHLDREPVLRLLPRSEITTYLKQFQRDPGTEPQDVGSADAAATDEDIEQLRDLALQAPVVRFVTQLVHQAVDRSATDIHVEPHEDHVRIRMRCDGILTVTDSAPRSLHAAFATRIKILSRLNIAERRLPQDGRMQATVRGQNIDLRVAITPSLFGESIVLRILDRSGVDLKLASLGFDEQAQASLRSLASTPNGIVLITGPTGSGKTTTLYSILGELNKSDVKIFTVEDPVEYRLPGVTQFQVDTAIDLDFARALRSAVRHDPDIILIGEIRDRETAEIAIRAALTGHLVFATLHTNSAASALTRLRDMGIDSYLLGATIRGIVSQRLVRKTCTRCSQRNHLTGSEFQTPICADCRGTGYLGRTVAYEILTVSREVSDLLSRGGTEGELAATARDEGMIPLSDFTRSLVVDGITTEAEARRVVQLEEA